MARITQPHSQDAAINAPATSLVQPDTNAPPRARGTVRLSAKTGPGGTCLGDLHQSGSLKALFPRNSGAGLQAVMINTAGGVTGGDRFTLQASAASGTELPLTTQAAERAYRAQPGQMGKIRNRVSVAPGARLNWLPQETILFQGSALDRSLRVDLAEDSRLLLCETLVLGRAAMGEVLNDACLRDRIEVHRAHRLHFVDAIRLDGDITAHLARPNTGGGAQAIAALLYISPDAEGHLEPLRAALPDTAGVSLIHPDTLFVRALAPDSFALRQTLVPILTRLSGAPLPRPWMI